MSRCRLVQHLVIYSIWCKNLVMVLILSTTEKLAHKGHRLNRWWWSLIAENLCHFDALPSRLSTLMPVVIHPCPTRCRPHNDDQLIVGLGLPNNRYGAIHRIEVDLQLPLGQCWMARGFEGGGGSAHIEVSTNWVRARMKLPVTESSQYIQAERWISQAYVTPLTSLMGHHPRWILRVPILLPNWLFTSCCINLHSTG